MGSKIKILCEMLLDKELDLTEKEQRILVKHLAPGVILEEFYEVIRRASSGNYSREALKKHFKMYEKYFSGARR